MQHTKNNNNNTHAHIHMNNLMCKFQQTSPIINACFKSFMFIRT